MRSPVLEDDDFDSRPTLQRVPPPLLLDLSAEDFARGWVARRVSRAERTEKIARRSRSLHPPDRPGALALVLGALAAIVLGGTVGIGAAVVRSDVRSFLEAFRDHDPIATEHKVAWRPPAPQDPELIELPTPSPSPPAVAVATAQAPRVPSTPPAPNPVTFVAKPIVKAPPPPPAQPVKIAAKPVATTSSDNPYDSPPPAPKPEADAPKSVDTPAPAASAAPPTSDITDKYDP